MDNRKPDFIGWATVYGTRCADKRSIKHGAFKDADKKTVPLVWNHNHNDIKNIIGNVTLEHKEEGLLAHGYLNETDNAVIAKALLKHGDVASLSIYANNIKEANGVVSHGVVREVSLVLLGANPGARIIEVLEHGEDGKAFVYESDTNVIMHGEDESGLSITFDNANIGGDPNNESDSGDPAGDSGGDNNISTESDDRPKEIDGSMTIAKLLETLTEEQKNTLIPLIEEYTTSKTKDNDPDEADSDNADGEGSDGGGSFQHSEGDKTIQDVLDTLTPEQKAEVDIVISENRKAIEIAIMDSLGEETKEVEFKEPNEEILNTLNDEQKQALILLLNLDYESAIDEAKKFLSEDVSIEHSDDVSSDDPDDADPSEKTIQDILETLTEEQRTAVEFIMEVNTKAVIEELTELMAKEEDEDDDTNN